jgi:hypothetical protein
MAAESEGPHRLVERVQWLALVIVMLLLLIDLVAVLLR